MFSEEIFGYVVVMVFLLFFSELGSQEEPHREVEEIESNSNNGGESGAENYKTVQKRASPIMKKYREIINIFEGGMVYSEQKLRPNKNKIILLENVNVKKMINNIENKFK